MGSTELEGNFNWKENVGHLDIVRSFLNIVFGDSTLCVIFNSSMNKNKYNNNNKSTITSIATIYSNH